MPRGTLQKRRKCQIIVHMHYYIEHTCTKIQTGPWSPSRKPTWIFLEGRSASVSVFAEMIVSGRRVLGY